MFFISITKPDINGEPIKPFYTLRRYYWTGNYNKKFMERFLMALQDVGVPVGHMEGPFDAVEWIKANALVTEPRYGSNSDITWRQEGRVGVAFESTKPTLFTDRFETLADAEAAMRSHVGHNHVYGFDILTHHTDYNENLMGDCTASEIRRYDAQGAMYECITADAVELAQGLRSGELVQFTEKCFRDCQSIGILLDNPEPNQSWIPVVTGTFDDELINLKVIPRHEIRRPAYTVPEEAASQLTEALQQFVAQRDKFRLEAFTAKTKASAVEAGGLGSVRATEILASLYAGLEQHYDNQRATLLCECARGWSRESRYHHSHKNNAVGLSAFARELSDKPGVYFNPRAANTAFWGHFLANINQIISLCNQLVEECTDPDVCRAVSGGAMQRVNLLLSDSNVWTHYLRFTQRHRGTERNKV